MAISFCDNVHTTVKEPRLYSNIIIPVWSGLLMMTSQSVQYLMGWYEVNTATR